MNEQMWLDLLRSGLLSPDFRPLEGLQSLHPVLIFVPDVWPESSVDIRALPHARNTPGALVPIPKILASLRASSILAGRHFGRALGWLNFGTIPPGKGHGSNHSLAGTSVPIAFQETFEP